MAVDYLQVRQEIEQLANLAPESAERLKSKQEQAAELLEKYSDQLDYLREKAQRASQLVPHFHVALPTTEPLNSSFPLPNVMPDLTLIAADGSQINPDRHMGTDFCMVNIGTIQLRPGSDLAPITKIESNLFYGEDVVSMQEDTVALLRDMREREVLAELAEKTDAPVITLTDGAVELWNRSAGSAEERDKNRDRYFAALGRLSKINAITAGYVDRPRTSLLVRLLEIAPEEIQPKDAGDSRQLSGLLDTDLLETVIRPGERSAIFGMLTRTSLQYRDAFALHFFYLNVSMRENKPILAKVEIPAWVAEVPEMVNALHAALVEQCQIMNTACYPYVLARADEIAVVKMKDKQKVTDMIANALRSRGLDVSGKSSKQQGKDVAR